MNDHIADLAAKITSGDALHAFMQFVVAHGNGFVNERILLVAMKGAWLEDQSIPPQTRLELYKLDHVRSLKDAHHIRVGIQGIVYCIMTTPGADLDSIVRSYVSQAYAA